VRLHVGEIERRFPMKKEERLEHKVKDLLRQVGVPRHLNHLGSKKFLLWQLCLGLLIKEVFRLSYRRAAKFLEEFYGIQVYWTTLQKFRKRMPLSLWQDLLLCTVAAPIRVAAIDGTGMRRSNPSEHYLKRIDHNSKVSVPVQLNALVDVLRRKFVMVRHHARRAGELADAYYLSKRVPPIDLVLMDKAYDSEGLHRFFHERGGISIAPVKANYAHGSLRGQLKECFDHALYWQRNIIESMFSALKRLFGDHLRGRTARTQRAEIFMRMIAYNLGARIKEIFYKADASLYHLTMLLTPSSKDVSGCHPRILFALEMSA
jgi:transposase